MSPVGVVEAFDVVEHIGSGLVPRSIDFILIRSVFSDEKKLSIAALSQTLPERLVEQVMPLSAIRHWKSSLAMQDCRQVTEKTPRNRVLKS